MKLIYLDTSNVALLTKIQTKSPTRLQNFLSLWRDSDFTLALSDAHFFEIMRYNSEAERNSRFDLIEKLLPIRIEKKLIDNEILLAFINKGIFTFSSEGVELRPQPFSQIIETPQQLSEQMRDLNLELFHNLYNMGYEAHKYSWEARAINPQGKKQKIRRLEELSAIELTDEKLKEFQQEWKKAKKDLLNNPYLPQEFLQFGTDFVENMFEEFILSANKSGSLKAFSDFIEIDSTDKRNLRKPIDFLIEQSNFQLKIKIVLNELGLEDELIESLANKISIEDCSGVWLGKQVETQIRKSGDSKPSNQLDVEHISHLPYVDIFFADKRIVQMVKQVLKLQDLPETIKHLKLPISISNSMEDLEANLFPHK